MRFDLKVFEERLEDFGFRSELRGKCVFLENFANFLKFFVLATSGGATMDGKKLSKSGKGWHFLGFYVFFDGVFQISLERDRVD